jgi:poly-gamma-glutamate synthesis protein (capsule biosynthesis protein)
MLNKLPLLFTACIFFASCAGTPVKSTSNETTKDTATDSSVAESIAPVFEDGTPIRNAENSFAGRDTILCTFGGDIMAHKPNFNMKNYDSIYTDIAPLLKESDLAFANMESPVDDEKPFESYPTFNMNHAYPDAAVTAGFNVFSLANNHANDQQLEGIMATRSYFTKKIAETIATNRPIYACGLKANKNGPLTYQVISVKGWTVLFVAVTEILNKPAYSSYIDFIKPAKTERALFKENLKKLRESHPCDLFVLSIHCSDPEYKQAVRKEQREFYYSLLNCGVDIVWANHTHVAKEWEAVGNKESGTLSKMVFFALGNTISAQRWEPNFTVPANEREYTGDGYLVQVRFEKTSQGVRIVFINPVLITTYITPSWNFVIKRLNDDFINELKGEGRDTWSAYLEERKILMEKTKGKSIWQ